MLTCALWYSLYDIYKGWKGLHQYPTYSPDLHFYARVPSTELVLVDLVARELVRPFNSFLHEFVRDSWCVSSGVHLYPVSEVVVVLLDLALKKPAFSGVSMAILSFYACKNLHKQATHKVFHAPMSFFDTTVSGDQAG